MLRWVSQALNCLSIHATYCVIIAGASPEETKMWAAVRENGIFCTCGSNNWENVEDRWMTGVHAARGLASTELIERHHFQWPWTILSPVLRSRCLMVVKLEWLGYRMVKKLWRYVKPFLSDTGTLRTDGQTDGQICYIKIVCMRVCTVTCRLQ